MRLGQFCEILLLFFFRNSRDLVYYKKLFQDSDCVLRCRKLKEVTDFIIGLSKKFREFVK